MIKEIMLAIGGARPVLPVSAGDVVIRDILGTGSDIVATRCLP